jgi:hypothetical protein
VITVAGLLARIRRLNELTKGFLLDQTRFVRQRSRLRQREREAYMRAPTQAGDALHQALEVLTAALARIDAETRREK